MGATGPALRGALSMLLVNSQTHCGDVGAAGESLTQMLAERMAAGIASGVYQIEHLAAVTFTRKAASELRGRFHLALEAELGSSSVRLQPDQTARAARRRRPRWPRRTIAPISRTGSRPSAVPSC